MSISTIELSQQHSYQQTSSQRREVTRLAPADLSMTHSNIEQPTTIARNTLVQPNLMQPNITPSIEIPRQSSINSDEQFTYEKPKTVRLQLMVLVLEQFLGRSLDIGEVSLSDKISQSHHNVHDNALFLQQSSSALNAEIMTIDGQSFQQGDLVSVEQWHSREQNLAYQVQGVFDINDKELTLNYEFALSSEQVSYSKIEMTAAALKDPLIVQYGAQGLGDIKGQTAFSINQDNIVDSLPIFSGDIGYLVFDKNDNQQADDGSELFGPQSGQGFVELSQLDSNKNGFIDTEDEQFEQLYLWKPSDNASTPEQWLSLKDVKIQAISLSAINTPFDFYDDKGEIQAQLQQSSFAISESGQGRGVHQVDVRI